MDKITYLKELIDDLEMAIEDKDKNNIEYFKEQIKKILKLIWILKKYMRIKQHQSLILNMNHIIIPYNAVFIIGDYFFGVIYWKMVSEKYDFVV